MKPLATNQPPLTPERDRRWLPDLDSFDGRFILFILPLMVFTLTMGSLAMVLGPSDAPAATCTRQDVRMTIATIGDDLTAFPTTSSEDDAPKPPCNTPVRFSQRPLEQKTNLDTVAARYGVELIEHDEAASTCTFRRPDGPRETSACAYAPVGPQTEEAVIDTVRDYYGSQTLDVDTSNLTEVYEELRIETLEE